MGGTDSSRHIHLLADSAFPEGAAGRKKSFISGLSGQIRHAAIKVHAAYRMAHRLGLLSDRNMGLVVVVDLIRLAGILGMFLIKIQRRLSSLVYEILGKFTVLFFPGDFA